MAKHCWSSSPRRTDVLLHPLEQAAYTWQLTWLDGHDLQGILHGASKSSISTTLKRLTRNAAARHNDTAG
eukprot:SM000058S18566  [mRNA]  locus=s58:682047:682420:+ [translate_table: standard]